MGALLDAVLLQAEVLDETGKMLIRSQTNRFYVQQTTVR